MPIRVRGFQARNSPQTLTRIGLAHGSVEGFTGDSARPVDHIAAEKHLSYFALGDWHGAKQVGERSWYSGTPEPDRFKGNDPGHVLQLGSWRPMRRLRSNPSMSASIAGPNPNFTCPVTKTSHAFNLISPAIMRNRANCS